MPITFNCPGCGKGYSVPDGVGGRPTKCRACGAAITIPMASQAPAAPLAAAPMAPFAASSAPTVDERPARSGRPFPFKIVGLIAAAVIVVVLIGGIGYALLGSSSPAAMKYMPDNTQVLGSVRVADFIKSGVWAEVKKQYPEVDQAITPALKDSPVQLEDVGQILFGVGDVAKQDVVVAVEFKKSIKLEDIVAFLNKQTGKTKQLTESKVGSYTVQGDNEVSLCQISSTMIIGGTPASIKAVLERDKKPAFSEGMQKALKDADLSQTVSFAVNFKDFAKNPMVTGTVKDSGMTADSIETAAMNVNVSSDIKVNAVTVCKDAKIAEENKTMAMGGLIAVKRMAGDQIPKEVMDIINSIKIEQKDNRLTTDLQFKIEPLIQLGKKFLGDLGPQEQRFQKVGQPIGSNGPGGPPPKGF